MRVGRVIFGATWPCASIFILTHATITPRLSRIKDLLAAKMFMAVSVLEIHDNCLQQFSSVFCCSTFDVHVDIPKCSFYFTTLLMKASRVGWPHNSWAKMGVGRNVQDGLRLRASLISPMATCSCQQTVSCHFMVRNLLIKYTLDYVGCPRRHAVLVILTRPISNDSH